jgi:hypothetical protein
VSIGHDAELPQSFGREYANLIRTKMTQNGQKNGVDTHAPIEGDDQTIDAFSRGHGISPNGRGPGTGGLRPKKKAVDAIHGSAWHMPGYPAKKGKGAGAKAPTRRPGSKFVRTKLPNHGRKAERTYSISHHDRLTDRTARTVKHNGRTRRRVHPGNKRLQPRRIALHDGACGTYDQAKIARGLAGRMRLHSERHTYRSIRPGRGISRRRISSVRSYK